LKEMRSSAFNEAFSVFHGERESEAADIADEVIYQALKARELIRNPGGWARIAGRRRAFNALKRIHRFVFISEPENKELGCAVSNSSHPSAENTLQAFRFAVRILRKLISHLPTYDKAIFLGRSKGWSDKEIANILGKSEQAVRRKWYRLALTLHTEILTKIEAGPSTARELLLEPLRDPETFSALLMVNKRPAQFERLIANYSACGFEGF
jgi:DNA-directed RNA polymerase specialized sigma24 family protein